jgi:hypothetical protein
MLSRQQGGEHTLLQPWVWETEPQCFQTGKGKKIISQTCVKNAERSQLWWLTQVIPTIQVAEIRKIAGPGQPEQKIIKTTTQLITGVWCFTLVVPATREVEVGGRGWRPVPSKNLRK